jgi:hypothetical protein
MSTSYVKQKMHDSFFPNDLLSRSRQYVNLIINASIKAISTGRLKKKCDMEKWQFCFINQLSNDFQQINFITCTNLVHCRNFEYKTFSHNTFFNQHMACQTF